MPQVQNVFGARIKQRLKEIGETQRWLANRSGIPEQTISNLINNRFEGSGNINQVVPIAKAMDTTCDFLFGLATRSEKPIYPSIKVRRLATVAELLPDADLNRLLLDAQRSLEVSRKGAWEADLVSAVDELVQRHGGDVEAVLRALDKLTGEEGDTEEAMPPSSPPSLFDELKK